MVVEIIVLCFWALVIWGGTALLWRLAKFVARIAGRKSPLPYTRAGKWLTFLLIYGAIAWDDFSWVVQVASVCVRHGGLVYGEPLEVEGFEAYKTDTTIFIDLAEGKYRYIDVFGPTPHGQDPVRFRITRVEEGDPGCARFDAIYPITLDRIPPSGLNGGVYRTPLHSTYSLSEIKNYLPAGRCLAANNREKRSSRYRYIQAYQT